MERRKFLVASATGLAGLSATGSPSAQAVDQRRAGKAKSTILFFLCGGASHIDMWDMKPDAPSDYRGPFQPIETSAPGVQLCEHLPMLAKQAHHLAVVNSIDGTVNTNDHHAGYYHNLTGHVPDQSFITLGNNRTPLPDDWPFMGSVVASKRTQNEFLPNAITLPHKPSRAPYTRPGQFAARIGVEHDPLYINGDRAKPLSFSAPSLALEGDVTADRLTERYSLLKEIDVARRQFERSQVAETFDKHQKRAVSLLMSSQTTTAFNVADESPATIERYGKTVNGMSLLVARRLVEAEVPFITVFWKGDLGKLGKKCRSAGSWDTHGNNFGCLKDDLLPEFDRGFSALVEDLAQRSLLDETLLLVTSEMGRKPKIGDIRSGGVSGAGRDHWTYCLTDVLAGGGVQGGQTYGASDRYAEHPIENKITPAHIAKTVYHAMGVDDLSFVDSLGRPYSLLDEGEIISSLF
ncbi:DUF1501 domain-containing protein [Fuerstiella marisgermanici]|uniref:DUF1501 domain-containing protein n=1 Tax=Fuerstiella marisgermanici TaxID=1891926 RepID=A0A1P8WRH4_9PLAN|nr:DUF1501 domain-containing protein [Fuerstiella marisgermanici]APZ96659.1 hypothetical protein Fuma_06332 [Fuerstiella marisgermanici]